MLQPRRPPARQPIVGPVHKPVAGTSCAAFPADNYWHADIRGLPRHRRNAQWLSHMSTGRDLHPDFGPSYGAGPDYGIPVTVVDHGHPRVRVRFDYAAESDQVRYPFGSDTRIEGGRDSAGDKHAVVVDRGACRLYETWNTRTADGVWRAGSGATWSLTSNALRPRRLDVRGRGRAADPAGSPALERGARGTRRPRHPVHHRRDQPPPPLAGPARRRARPTASPTRRWARGSGLRAGFSTTGFGPAARTVIRAMKKHGLVLADNGSPWFFQGEQNAHWPDRLISDLKRDPRVRLRGRGHLRTAGPPRLRAGTLSPIPCPRPASCNVRQAFSGRCSGCSAAW